MKQKLNVEHERIKVDILTNLIEGHFEPFLRAVEREYNFIDNDGDYTGELKRNAIATFISTAMLYAKDAKLELNDRRKSDTVYWLRTKTISALNELDDINTQYQVLKDNPCPDVGI